MEPKMDKSDQQGENGSGSKIKKSKSKNKSKKPPTTLTKRMTDKLERTARGGGEEAEVDLKEEKIDQ